MRRTLKLLALLLIISIVMSLAGCGGSVVSHCELHIKLPSGFAEYDSDGSYDLAYSDGNLIVGILRFSHSACLEEGIPITLTPLKFAELYKNKAEGLDNLSEIREYGDIPYFTYILEGAGGNSYCYMPTFYKSYYAYFLVMFITPHFSYDAIRVEIFELIDTIYMVNDKVN